MSCGSGCGQTPVSVAVGAGEAVLGACSSRVSEYVMGAYPLRAGQPAAGILHALDGSAPDVVDSSVLSGSAPAGAVGAALHGPWVPLRDQPTNEHPTNQNSTLHTLASLKPLWVSCLFSLHYFFRLQ